MAKKYFYKAKDQSGQMLSGCLFADSEKAVAVHIRGKGGYVLQIKEQSNSRNLLLTYFNIASLRDIALLCRQLTTMLEAGVSLVVSLGVVIEQTKNIHLKAALQTVYLRVKEGQAFSQALAEHPRLFPTIMINMVEAGELGGVLGEMLERLSSYFEKEHKLNEKIKTAMTYPTVVMIMAILAISFIVTLVLPSFINLFNSMKVELPWTTRFLLGVGEFLAQWWLMLLLVMAVLSILGKIAVDRPAVKKVWGQIILRIPIVGQLVRKVAIARFSRILGTLIRSGVPLIAALDVVKKVTNNLSMTDAISNSQERLAEGVSLAATFAACNVFTPLVIQMVAVGEESGTVGKMLEKVADFYEDEIDDMAARLSSLMEPVIVGILGVLIGFIVVAMVLPLFDVITNIGNDM